MTMAWAGPPEQEELSQMAAKREALAGAALSRSAAADAVAKAVRVRDGVLLIGGLQYAKNPIGLFDLNFPP